jgi:hypothetical protein
MQARHKKVYQVQQFSSIKSMSVPFEDFFRKRDRGLFYFPDMICQITGSVTAPLVEVNNFHLFDLVPSISNSSIVNRQLPLVIRH